MNHSPKFLFISILFLITCTCLGINSDSLKVEKLGAKSLEFVYSYPDSARQKINQGFNLSEKMDDPHMISLMYNYQGIYYDVTGNYDSAMISYRKAVGYGIEAKKPHNTAGALNNIGLLFWNSHEYDSAVTYYYKALDIYKEIGNKTGQGNVLSNIGLIYTNQIRIDKALEALNKSLKIKYELNDTLGIGKTYANIGGALEKKELFDSSLFYKKKAEPFLVGSGNNYELATLYHDFGVTHNILKNYEAAILYGEKALALRRKLGSKKYIASTLNMLGGAYHRTKEYDKGHQVLDEAIAIYEKYNIYRLLKGCYHRKAMILRDQGEYEKAIIYFEKNIAAYEEAYSEDRIEKLLQVEGKYESEKSRSQILQQEKELLEKETKATRMTVILVFLILLTIGIFMFFRNRIRKNKAKKKQELLEQKLEISRELHDNIGSQLTYLTHGLEKAIKSDDRSKLEEISSFSKGTMGDLRTAVWGLNKELTVSDLAAKISDEIAKVKSSEDIEVVFTGDKSDLVLNTSVAINTFRIVQEALQNAVKHSNALAVDIRLKVENEKLNVSIKDNGDGFEMKSYKGFGLKSMQQRADKIGADIQIISKLGGGTEVLLKLNTANAL